MSHSKPALALSAAGTELRIYNCWECLDPQVLEGAADLEVLETEFVVDATVDLCGAEDEGGCVSAELLADPVRDPEFDDLEPGVAMDDETRQVWKKAWADFVLSVS